MTPTRYSTLQYDCIPEGNWADGVDVYLKSEADKCINHHKYKRCKAMRDWCYAHHFMNHEWLCAEKNPDEKRRLERKTIYWWRWWNIWLELAEQFKGES